MPKHSHLHHVHQRAAHLIRDAQPEKQEEEDQPMVISIVYVTASKTFDGPVGGYKTLNPPTFAHSAIPDNKFEKDPSDDAESKDTSEVDSDTHPTSKPSPKAKETSKEELDSASESPFPTSSKTTSKSSFPTFSPASKTASTEAHSPSVAHAAQQSSSSTSTVIGEAAASGAASNAAPAASASQSQGMSGGAKAGLAIGVILIIGVLGLILLCLRRTKNKKKSYQKTDDEKAALEPQRGLARTQSIQSTRTTATAPRLSLRPVTQFLPDLAARRKSGNLLATNGGQSQNALAVSQEQTSEKPTSPIQSSSPANPFGPHAEISHGAALPVNVNTQPTNPFENHAEDHDESGRRALSPPVQAPAPLRIRTPTPEAASAASLAALNNIGAPREDRYKPPNQRNLSPSRPISPAGTEFSISSVSTGYMAHGPPPSNVHRVQLDFSPSMDDELALQAGQLIRLLHEYDDGWALCIRLDRSQQGVAPRTCLSARPVKPRPAGNNRGPPLRGSPPPGMFGPGQQRPMSPPGGRGPPNHFNREQAPMFPTTRLGPRSMSPGPYGGGPQRPHMPPSGGKRRSNSASQIRDRRNSPPGPSPMNSIASNMQRMPMPVQLQAGMAAGGHLQPSRKPVPGQAM